MRYRNKEAGIILPIVIIFTLVLTITGLAFLNMTVMENRLVKKEIIKKQSFYLAEAGVEHARVQLGRDWNDLTTIGVTALGEGIYSADISESGEFGENRKVVSVGTVNATSKTVQVVLKSRAKEITWAIETGGQVNVSGSATIDGDVVTESESFESPDEYFQTIFGVSKDEMRATAQRSPNRYYDYAISNEIVQNITWVDGSPDQSQITSNTWTGSGIWIVNGDLKITGGTFEGILWVTGSLEVTAGNPIISGAVFVESTMTVDILGNLTLTHDADAIAEAFGTRGIVVVRWDELPLPN